MAMVLDSRQQMSGMPYEPMRYHAAAAPQFTDPWAPASAGAGQVYASSLPHHGTHASPAASASAAVGADQHHQHQHHRQSLAVPTTASMQYQQSNALPALALPTGTLPVDSMFAVSADSHGQGYAPRPYGATDYPVSTASVGTTTYSAPTSAPQQYATADYSGQKLGAYGFADRRPSHPLQPSTEAQRSSFSDALDASRGMVAMSQDITPRNIYGAQASSRASTDSYGFPSAHSSHSSISSASGYGSYYGGSSVSEASYGDYSSAGESVDVPSRTLPRPSGLMGANLPPAPQTMMGQFSSKVSSSSQKKHKCKVCDKRFTRPSSLQTHMYSHTGEKPFACDFEGCGRHFSVVSNLRRHKKVHKGQSDGDHPSPDDE